MNRTKQIKHYLVKFQSVIALLIMCIILSQIGRAHV